MPTFDCGKTGGDPTGKDMSGIEGIPYPAQEEVIPSVVQEKLALLDAGTKFTIKVWLSPSTRRLHIQEVTPVKPSPPIEMHIVAATHELITIAAPKEVTTNTVPERGGGVIEITQRLNDLRGGSIRPLVQDGFMSKLGKGVNKAVYRVVGKPWIVATITAGQGNAKWRAVKADEIERVIGGRKALDAARWKNANDDLLALDKYFAKARIFPTSRSSWKKQPATYLRSIPVIPV